MRAPGISSLLLLVPLLAVVGCASAEADRVCVTEAVSRSQVPAAAGTIVLDGQPLPVPLKLRLDLGAAVPDADRRGISVELFAQSLSVTSLEGADLSGIERVQVTLVAAGHPDVVFAYERPAGSTGPVRTLTAVPDRRANLVDYLQDGRTLTIADPRFTGRLPSTAWTPQLRTCAGPSVDVDLTRAAGL